MSIGWLEGVRDARRWCGFRQRCLGGTNGRLTRGQGSIRGLCKGNAAVAIRHTHPNANDGIINGTARGHGTDNKIERFGTTIVVIDLECAGAAAQGGNSKGKDTGCGLCYCDLEMMTGW